ncbi:MAG: helix-turn-helix domain-containing protein [Prevotella sp.]
MAVTLAISRIHILRCYKAYEKSRWILVVALSLLCVHYLLQMMFDLRASGDDVGALFNILFYSPVVFLFSYAVLNLECSREMLRRHLCVGIAGYAFIFAVFIVGYSWSGSIHIGASLYVMNILFLICMIYFVIIPTREIRRTYRRIESHTSGDMQSYIIYIRTGFYLLCFSALSIPFGIVKTSLLFVLGPLLLVVIVFFVVNFLALGYNAPMLQTIQENQEDPAIGNDKNPSYKGEVLQAERAIAIKKLLDSWVESKGFIERELSLSSLSLCLGVSRRELTIYFEHHECVTFRVWLSNIRFELAKKMMCEHPEYSNDAISAACGFSSRAQLYNIFRDKEGMTPKEYLTRHLDKS